MIAATVAFRRRRPARCASRVRGFTLVELMVSLVVIIIILAIVTNVFGVAAKTTRVAEAIQTVQTQLDSLANDIEEDLRYTRPNRSVMVIYGRKQAASLTEAERQARRYYRILTGNPDLVAPVFDATRDASGQDVTSAAQYSDPRADLLMFFTERPSETHLPIDPSAPASAFQRSLALGSKGSPVQVVYGHAALADTVPNPANAADFGLTNIRHIEQTSAGLDSTKLSRMPLTDWRLARRALIIEPARVNSASDAVAARRIDLTLFSGLSASVNPALSSVLTQAAVINNFNGGVMVATGDRSPDTIPFDLNGFLSLFDPNPDLDAGARGILNPPAGYATTVQPRVSRVALASPYRWQAGGGGFNGAGNPVNVNGVVNADPILDTLYPNSDVDGDGLNERAYRHFATAIVDPPGALRGNLGMQRLTGCLWFQVEFLMPEDPRNAWDHPDGRVRAALPRWVSVEPDKYYVFVPDSTTNRALIEAQAPTANGGAIQNADVTRLRQFAPVIDPGTGNAGYLQDRRIRLWPYAIRITIRAIDSKAQISEPITRTIEHWFD